VLLGKNGRGRWEGDESWLVGRSRAKDARNGRIDGDRRRARNEAGYWSLHFTFEEFAQMVPNFPQSMPNLQSLTLMLDDTNGWNPPTDPFESLTHTFEELSLFYSLFHLPSSSSEHLPP